MERKRILFFDLVRVIAILMVVIQHVPHDFFPLNFGMYIPHYGLLNIGRVGVFLFIFVSGAVLEYNYGNKAINSISEMVEFYYRRLVRIYPAYWISLIIGIAIAPFKINVPPSSLFFQFIGFSPWINDWDNSMLINPMGWFICLIVSLYFLYPFISSMMKKKTYITLLVLFIISMSSKSFIVSHETEWIRLDYWFPLAIVFNFGLGIFIIRTRVYPKQIHHSQTLSFLSELAFYVYLTHFLVISYWYISPYIFVTLTLVPSMGLYALDKCLQGSIRKFNLDSSNLYRLKNPKI